MRISLLWPSSPDNGYVLLALSILMVAKEDYHSKMAYELGRIDGEPIYADNQMWTKFCASYKGDRDPLDVALWVANYLMNSA